MAFGATACTATPPLTPSEVIGKPYETVSHAVAENAELIVQDSSPRVDRTPSFELGLEPSGYVVVAACADDADLRKASSVEVAVIPEDSLTAEVEADLESGKYEDAVDCEGRSHR